VLRQNLEHSFSSGSHSALRSMAGQNYTIKQKRLQYSATLLGSINLHQSFEDVFSFGLTSDLVSLFFSGSFLADDSFSEP